MKATVDVGWLQTKLKDNRAKHLATFEKALAVYREKVLEQMERNLEEARKGKEPSLFISLARPMNQTADYDRVLSMLEAMLYADENRIELTEEDFSQYVMDQWHWKQQFSVTNAAYGVSEE